MPLLVCIADDFTGATDLANTLVKGGMTAVQVIGVPDPRWGEAIKACVIRKAGTTLTEAELIAFAKERLAGYKVPKSVDFVESFPLVPSGKVSKKDLRAPYWENLGRSVA